MEEEYHSGDQVIVPWGLDELVGEVIEIQSTGLGQRLIVRLKVPDAPAEAEDMLITLPPSALKHVTSNATPAASGSWASPLHYERQLYEALLRVLKQRSLGSSIKRAKGDKFDFVIRISPEIRVFVEAKYRETGFIASDVINQVEAALSGIGRQYQNRILVVANVDFAAAANARVRQLSAQGLSIRVVRWRGEQDDSDLIRSLNLLLANVPQ